MDRPNKCKNCQWYGKPYWSIINPCDNCPMENVETFTHWIDPNIKEFKEENEKLKEENIKLKAELYDANITKDNYVKLVNRVAELEEENKKLQECYCNRTDCSGRIKDSKKYESVQQKLDKIMDYCKSNIQFYDDGEYQGEDCCVDGFEIIKMIEDEENGNN